MYWWVDQAFMTRLCPFKVGDSVATRNAYGTALLRIVQVFLRLCTGVIGRCLGIIICGAEHSTSRRPGRRCEEQHNELGLQGCGKRNMRCAHTLLFKNTSILAF